MDSSLPLIGSSDSLGGSTLGQSHDVNDCLVLERTVKQKNEK